MQLHIGSYSIPSPWTGTPGAHGAGITEALLDLRTGRLQVTGEYPETNPSFLVPDSAAGKLWAITEPEYGGDLITFDLSGPASLAVLGRHSTGADAPCHVTVDVPLNLAFASHYHGASVTLLPLGPSGAPQATLQTVTPPEQARGLDRSAHQPRPHSSVRIPGTNELLVADCGRDLVLLYTIERVAEGVPQLILRDALPLRVGTGPRHIAYQADLGLAFISNQNSGSVSVVRRTAHGLAVGLELASEADSPGLGRGKSIPSEIALHPDGQVLYMANRVDDSLSVYGITSEDGHLALIDCVDVEGRNPRHFALTPCGRFLLVANQESDQVTSFHISDDGRKVEWTGNDLAVATPTCVSFWNQA